MNEVAFTAKLKENGTLNSKFALGRPKEIGIHAKAIPGVLCILSSMVSQSAYMGLSVMAMDVKETVLILECLLIKTGLTSISKAVFETFDSQNSFVTDCRTKLA